MLTITNAQVFDLSGEFVPGSIGIDGGDFAAPRPGGDELDAAGCYAVPGLIDVHFHGCVGEDFSTSDLAGMEKMAAYEAENGITAICPATTTMPEETLAAACRNMARLGGDARAQLAGIQLEGPFVSSQKLGAQNPAYARAPDSGLYHRLQQAAGGLVKLVTVAPELPGAMGFIAEVSCEVRCSIAHTTADYATALEAFARGAGQVTHLYNAMPPLSHREPGVIGAALDTPDCFVELICDGIHIHPSVVRATFRMFGDRRIVLISDSMMATGLSDGDYELGGLAVRVAEGTARLVRDGAIAGSVRNLADCVRTAVLEMNIPLWSAVHCATVNPARSIGVFDRRGSITPGKVADLLLLGEDLSLRQVFVRGVPLLTN